MIKVGDTSVTPNALVSSPAVPVDGPTTVLMTPWGAWSERFEVTRGDTTRATLPKTVGIPPLRALMLRDEYGELDEDRSVITARADLSGSSIVDAEGRQVGGRAGPARRTRADLDRPRLQPAVGGDARPEVATLRLP